MHAVSAAEGIGEDLPSESTGKPSTPDLQPEHVPCIATDSPDILSPSPDVTAASDSCNSSAAPSLHVESALPPDLDVADVHDFDASPKSASGHLHKTCTSDVSSPKDELPISAGDVDVRPATVPQGQIEVPYPSRSPSGNAVVSVPYQNSVDHSSLYTPDIGPTALQSIDSPPFVSSPPQSVSLSHSGPQTNPLCEHVTSEMPWVSSALPPPADALSVSGSLFPSVSSLSMTSTHPYRNHLASRSFFTPTSPFTSHNSEAIYQPHTILQVPLIAGTSTLSPALQNAQSMSSLQLTNMSQLKQSFVNPSFSLDVPGPATQYDSLAPSNPKHMCRAAPSARSQWSAPPNAQWGIPLEWNLSVGICHECHC